MLDQIIVSRADEWLDVGLLVFRVAIGVCFVIHALGKLGWVGPPNSLEGFAAWLDQLGVPAPRVQAHMAMWTELIGGACLVMGFATRPAGILLAGTMIVAAIIGHRGGGYLVINTPSGAVQTINLGVIAGLIATVEPGSRSVDHFFVDLS